MAGDLRYDAATWRSLARWGATQLPEWWLRGSPGPIAVAIGMLDRDKTRALRDAQRLVLGARHPLVEQLDVASALATYGHCLAEGLAASAKTPPKFSFEVEGAEHLPRLRERGAVMVTAHAGSWEIAGGALGGEGLDVAIVMAAERDAGARAVSDDARHKLGVKVLHVGADPLSALPLVRHVRERGVVALQIDRVPAGMKHVECTLFGRPFAMPLGPFAVARATGAPIVPAFTARVGHLRHYIELHEPIALPTARGASLQPVVDAVAFALERFLRRFPNQWFQFATTSPP